MRSCVRQVDSPLRTAWGCANVGFRGSRKCDHGKIRQPIGCCFFVRFIRCWKRGRGGSNKQKPRPRFKNIYMLNMRFLTKTMHCYKKNMLSQKQELLRRTHWRRKQRKLWKKRFGQKPHFVRKKECLRRTHWLKKRNLKKLIFAAKTHSVQHRKSACGVRTGLTKKNRKKRFCSKRAFCQKQ